MGNFDVVEYIAEQEEFFLPVLSTPDIKWEQEKQFAIQCFQNSDYLLKIAKQNPASLQNALINVSSIGISLNPASKHAYLIPRKGKVCLDISYMGMAHLALSTGSIEWCQSIIVYSNDTYKNNGVDVKPSHDYDSFSSNRGDPIGVYCTVKTPTGAYLTDELSKQDVYRARDCSESYKTYLKKKTPCCWTKDEMEMWRKTAVKRASKYWPKVDRLNSAIQLLNTDNGEGISNEKDITPEFIENPIQVLKDILIEREAKEVDYLSWLRVEKFEDVTEEMASKAVITLRAGAQK
jgi:recombination protein RecT